MFKKEIDKLAVVNKSSDMEVSQDAGQLGNNHNELNQPTRQDKTRQDKTKSVSEQPNEIFEKSPNVLIRLKNCFIQHEVYLSGLWSGFILTVLILVATKIIPTISKLPDKILLLEQAQTSTQQGLIHLQESQQSSLQAESARMESRINQTQQELSQVKEKLPALAPMETVKIAQQQLSGLAQSIETMKNQLPALDQGTMITDLQQQLTAFSTTLSPIADGYNKNLNDQQAQITTLKAEVQQLLEKTNKLESSNQAFNNQLNVISSKQDVLTGQQEAIEKQMTEGTLAEQQTTLEVKQQATEIPAT